MAKRLRLQSDEGNWTAEVSGASIAIAPADADGSAQAARTDVLTVRVHDEGDGRFRIDGGGGPGAEAGELHGAAAQRGDAIWVALDGHVLRFATFAGDADDHSATRDHDALLAPMPATVVRIAVSAGDAVKRGDLIMVLEAMKMELPIRAPRDMVVGAIRCRVGELVPAGHELVTT